MCSPDLLYRALVYSSEKAVLTSKKGKVHPITCDEETQGVDV